MVTTRLNLWRSPASTPFVTIVCLLLGCVAEKHRNYLGIEYVHLVSTQPGGPGALVTTVKACSPATEAGLHVGDIIVAIGNQSVDGETLDKKLQALPERARVTIRVLRSGKSITLRTTLWGDNLGVLPSAAPYFGVGATVNKVGAVVIYCIYRDSPAALAGMQPGDTIVSMNGEVITASNYDEIRTHFDAGQSIPIVVKRNAIAHTLNVTFTDDDPPDEKLQVDGIKLLDGMTERIIDVEEIPMNNCAGNATLESHRTFTKKVSRQMTLNIDGELEVFGVAPFMLAQAKLATQFDYNTSDEISESKTEVMRAEPHSFVTYVVTWYEVSNKGIVGLRANGISHSVPFEVTRRLRVQTRAGSETPCTR